MVAYAAIVGVLLAFLVGDRSGGVRLVCQQHRPGAPTVLVSRRLHLDVGRCLAAARMGVLDGGATLVDQSPKGRRGEYGRNSGATSTDTFCQSALEVQI